MKKIKTLYGGNATLKDGLCAGDTLQVRILDDAVTLLLNEEYLNAIKDKAIKDIKIEMTKNQYKFLELKNLTLLFTKYFNYENIRFTSPTNRRSDWTSIESVKVIMENKFVEILVAKE